MTNDELIRRGDALDEIARHADNADRLSRENRYMAKLHEARKDGILSTLNAIAALPAVTPQPVGVTVKPLEFRNSYGVLRAETPFGDYMVVRTILHLPGRHGAQMVCADAEAAQAAAQADYEARILSAIEPAPVTLPEAAQVQALVELAEELITAVWHLMDNSEESGPIENPKITVWKPDFDEVSAILDRIEGLPSGSIEHMTAGELFAANILAALRAIGRDEA